MRLRLATLFVDIAGSTRLLAHHPPETVLGVVQCFAALVTEPARAHDGRVKDFLDHHVGNARETGVDADEIAEALDVGRMVRQGAATTVDRLAARLRTGAAAAPAAGAGRCGCA